jgi:hypothetical protein
MGGVVYRNSVSATAFLNLHSRFGRFVSALKIPFPGKQRLQFEETRFDCGIIAVLVSARERTLGAPASVLNRSGKLMRVSPSMLRRFVLPTSRSVPRPAIGNPVSWDRQRLQIDKPLLVHLNKPLHEMLPRLIRRHIVGDFVVGVRVSHKLHRAHARMSIRRHLLRNRRGMASRSLLIPEERGEDLAGVCGPSNLLLSAEQSEGRAANEPTTFQAWSRGRRSRCYGEFLDTIAHTIQCLD